MDSKLLLFLSSKMALKNFCLEEWRFEEITTKPQWDRQIVYLNRSILLFDSLRQLGGANEEQKL